MKFLPDSPDITCFTPEQQKASVIRRLERTKEIICGKVDKVIRREIHKTAAGEDVRCWLGKFAKGNGLDICSGRYVVEGAMGVDSGIDYSLGATFDFRGDNLATIENGGMDFVVCNYFDCFESPIKTLREWQRVLRDDGKIAFTCTNCECYDVRENMLNGKRQQLFTPHSINLLMHYIGFKNIKVQTHKSIILVEGNK